jgi:hypothetical protein
MLFISPFYRLFDIASKLGVSFDPSLALLRQDSLAARTAASLLLDQSNIQSILRFLQVPPRLSIAYSQRFAGCLQRPFGVDFLEQPPFAVAECAFDTFAA